MYGWDSYFILLGLLKDNRADLARVRFNDSAFVQNDAGETRNIEFLEPLVVRDDDPCLYRVPIRRVCHVRDAELSGFGDGLFRDGERA